MYYGGCWLFYMVFKKHNAYNFANKRKKLKRNEE